MSIPRKLKRHVHPWRHRPESIVAPTLRPLKAVKKVLTEDFGDGGWYRRESKHLPAPLHDAMQEGITLLADLDEARIRDASVATLTCSEALCVAMGTSLLEPICAVHTPDDALAIAWEAHALVVLPAFRHAVNPVEDFGPQDTWKPLRAHLAGAVASEHATARERAESLRKGDASAQRRQLPVYVFPGTAWSDELLREDPEQTLMAAALSTLDRPLLTRLAKETGPPERLPLLVTAAVGLEPEDALAWLDDVLTATVDEGYWTDVPDLISALSLFPREAVEAIVAPHRSIPQVAKAITRILG